MTTATPTRILATRKTLTGLLQSGQQVLRTAAVARVLIALTSFVSLCEAASYFGD